MELVCLACNSTFLDRIPVKRRIVKKNETGNPKLCYWLEIQYFSHRTEIEHVEAYKIVKQLSKEEGRFR